MTLVDNRVAQAAARTRALSRVTATSRRLAAIAAEHGPNHEAVTQRQMLVDRWELEARAFGATDCEVREAKTRAPILVGQS